MALPPEVVFFTLNGTWLGLYGRKVMAHNVGLDMEVDVVVAQAADAGATLARMPQKRFWGGCSRYLKNPDGPLWEMAHNPMFRVGPTNDEA